MFQCEFLSVSDIALLITQSAHREYSPLNDINDIDFFISIQVLCHVVDLKHGFVTSWENVLFTLENMNLC